VSLTIDLRVCELLTARLCHDLAGPLAAVTNGAELLDDEDPDFAREAAGLIGDSARTAARRLQLFRHVYGFSRGGTVGPPPHSLAAEYFAGSAIDCEYPDAVRALGPEWQRLGCALLLLGAEGLPRGGRLALEAAGKAVALTATGEGDGPSPEMRAAMTLAAPVEELTSRSVGAYFAGLLARELGCRLGLAAEPGGFRIICEAGA
jgi:histidine phosphotransferase ChpT